MTRFRTRSLIARSILVAAFAFGSISSARHGASATVPNATGAPLGSAAPAFDGRALDGRTHSPAEYRGRVLVLNFWATWCPPCRAETADLVASYRALRAPDVAFLGVDTTEAAPVVASFVSAHDVPYDVVLANPQAYNDFGISYIPTTIVLDARGIVRARWIGGVTPAQMRSYVESARRGVDAQYVTAEQRHIDAMLAPWSARFANGARTSQADATGALRAIGAVDAYALQISSDDRPPRFDSERTNLEKGALLLAAGTALEKKADSKNQRVLALKCIAQGQGFLDRWADAAATYRRALVLMPHAASLESPLVSAYYRLHDYDAMAAAAKALIADAQSLSAGYEQLGLAEERRADYGGAVAPYRTYLERSIAAENKLRGTAGDGDAVADIADVSLDLADVYVALGDAANASATFTQSEEYADRIPAKNPAVALKTRSRERASEGMIALELGHGHGTKLSLERWSGADLPGSNGSTFKYRLTVVGAAQKNVTLRAQGLADGWIASFCADGLCSPNTVSFAMPATGVKTYEFQLVPPQLNAPPGPVSVLATMDASSDAAVEAKLP